MIHRREANMARRVSILGALMVGILWLASTPALAKGQEVRESVTISVSGPSLSKPVQLHWKGRCPLGFFPCPQSLSDFSVAMSDIGMLSARGAAYGPPPASKLGPKYDMTVTFDLKDGPTYVVHKDLYPFGPGTSAFLLQRPWLFTPPDSESVTWTCPMGGSRSLPPWWTSCAITGSPWRRRLPPPR